MSMNLTAADRLEIHELLARYAWALDTADVDAFAACFASQGELCWDSFEVPLRWQGTAALRAFASALRELPGSAGRQHHVSNLVVTGTGEGASARAYALVTLREPDGSVRAHVAGYYEDELCVEDDAWRIRRRTIRDWAGPVLGRFAGQTGERPSRPLPPPLQALAASSRGSE